jgi:hypothetical protein
MDDAVVFEVAAFISGGGRAVDAWQELVVGLLLLLALQ